jgi:acyl-coenzyme A synthetase/AMP-(fatty) acid ligase
MSDKNPKPWLIDGRTGAATSYGQLLANLNRAPAEVRSLCQPASVSDALGEIAKALAFGEEIILFDTDFGEREIESLGFLHGELNQPSPVTQSRVVDISSLAAVGQSATSIGLFTSGSTGLPKLVWQKISNLARAVKVSARHGEAVWALAYNPTHVAAIQVYLQALANGCTVVNVYGLDRVQVLAALERHGVSHLSATPSFYRLLLPANRPLPAIRSVTMGGESSDASLQERLRPLFPSARFHNVYASTEAGTLLVADGDVFAIAPTLEGRVEVRDGRLSVHHSLLGKFAGHPSGGQTSETGRQTARNEEWYDTGDVVEIVSTEPLRFRIGARERDWVNVGGSKVNPHEVEAAIGEHPGVVQVRVFGRKNSVIGHILCAEVVLAKAESGLQTAEGGRVTEPVLRNYAATRLQAFKVPRVIRFVDSLGTTRTGKLSRTEDGR